jgi:hypothetical protein
MMPPWVLVAGLLCFVGLIGWATILAVKMAKDDRDAF